MPILSDGLHKIYSEQIEELLVEFGTDHLPTPLKEVAIPFSGLANLIVNQTPAPSGEKLRALEYLRISRDAAVRDAKNSITEFKQHISPEEEV